MDLACILTRIYLRLALPHTYSATETTRLWKGPPAESHLFTPLNFCNTLFLSNVTKHHLPNVPVTCTLVLLPLPDCKPLEGRDRGYTSFYAHVLNRIGAKYFDIECWS